MKGSWECACGCTNSTYSRRCECGYIKLTDSEKFLDRWILRGFSGEGTKKPLSFSGRALYTYRYPILRVLEGRNIPGVVVMRALRPPSSNSQRHEGRACHRISTLISGVRFLYCYDDVMVGPCKGELLRSDVFKNVERQALSILRSSEDALSHMPRCNKLSTFTSCKHQVDYIRNMAQDYVDMMMDERQKRRFALHVKELYSRMESLVSEERMEDLRVREVCRKL